MAGKICNARGRLLGDYGPLINHSEPAFYRSHKIKSIVFCFRLQKNGKYFGCHILHLHSSFEVLFITKDTFQMFVDDSTCPLPVLQRRYKKFNAVKWPEYGRDQHKVFVLWRCPSRSYCGRWNCIWETKMVKFLIMFGLCTFSSISKTYIYMKVQSKP